MELRIVMSNIKQRGLGRDLEALLGKRRVPETAPAAHQMSEFDKARGDAEAVSFDAQATKVPQRQDPELKNNELRQIPIEQLQPGRYQPRREFPPESLEELASSIRAHGVIQPLIIRSIGAQKYEIIAGERRWRAAQLAGLANVPSVLRELSDQTASALALIENVQREDLSAMDEAIAYHRLTDEFGLTHQEVSDLVGKSRAAISNALRLINLNADVKNMLQNGDLEIGHAKVLLALTGSAQSEAARTVVNKSLSVRDTEQLVRRWHQAPVSKVTPGLDPDTRKLQDQLSEKLGAKVEIQHAGKKGKLVIHYTSLDELDGILAHIK